MFLFLNDGLDEDDHRPSIGKAESMCRLDERDCDSLLTVSVSGDCGREPPLLCSIYCYGRVVLRLQSDLTRLRRLKVSQREQDVNSLRSSLLQMAADTLVREGSFDTAHDVDHVARTMALAETLHRREGGDLATILATVAFHDVGQERERREGGDHAVIGAEMAAERLRGTWFPEAAIPAVQEAIREHRMTGAEKPRSLEGRIVYDADKLDSLGAVGVARLYCITGLLGQKVYAPTPDNLNHHEDPSVLRELRKSRAYSSNIEFDLLLADLPRQLLTPTGRALARERHDYMRAFFERLRQEVEGQL